MLREDTNGFVYFPNPNEIIKKIDEGKTYVYLVAFDTEDLSNKAYELSNLRLLLPGQFVSDDIQMRQKVTSTKSSIDNLIEDALKQEEFEKVYFPNKKEKSKPKKNMSIPFTSAICLGWTEGTFEVKDIAFWSACFRDLTHEGKKLYYSIKKLHNNKEVRILTFTTI